MKKFFVALTVMIMAVLTPAKAGLDWGITAGWNLSKMSVSSEVLKSDNHTGWYAGAKAVFTIPVIGLGIDGSLVYSQRQLSLETEDELTNESTGELKTVRSLAIPINLRYTFGFSSIAGVYVATGPQFNINIGNKAWDDIKGATLRSTDLSWNIGAGVKLLSHLEIGAAYNIPLGKTAEYSNVSDLKDVNYSDIKTKTWQVSATYYF
jgi:hypothetical protein